MTNKPWLKQVTANKEIEVMGAKIQVKKLTFGESRKAIQGAFKQVGLNKQPELDQTLASILRSIKMIESWDLTDEHGQELAISIDTIDFLDEEFVGELIQALNAEDENEVTPEEKKL